MLVVDKIEMLLFPLLNMDLKCWFATSKHQHLLQKFSTVHIFLDYKHWFSQSNREEEKKKEKEVIYKEQKNSVENL